MLMWYSGLRQSLPSWWSAETSITRASKLEQTQVVAILLLVPHQDATASTGSGREHGVSRININSPVDSDFPSFAEGELGNLQKMSGLYLCV